MKKAEMEQVRLVYETPALQLVVFNVEDVIATSQDADGGEYGDWA